MKLPQTFATTAHKLVNMLKSMSLARKRGLILCGAALLCFALVLPFLNNPKTVSQAVNKPAPAHSPVIVARTPVEMPQPVDNTAVEKPKVHLKDLGQPLQGKVLRGTSRDAIWWNVFQDYRQHTGVDLHAEPGTKVVAAGAGTVVELGTDPAYGKVIVIDHGSGLKTVYGQLEQLKVKLNDKVNKGQTLGQVGRAAGGEADQETHLHYEVWQNNLIINGK